MPDLTVIDVIIEELGQLARNKGETLPVVTAETVFLDDTMPIDSLDLATLLVVLERRLGYDPFRKGFRQFRSVGELAAMYQE